ncbi:MAG: F0F1 ATP synthase subunit delta [Variovorax paradoxus]|uniref:F0F1 ATP synthase subunit delta n=1 Tax=Variovorax paradoxus TaxID=34073 RepID=A0A2W5RWZ4_VARPD|nr:MAG: F0F1 ATP synthase subunit delta [Variovorax paradoxus]
MAFKASAGNAAATAGWLEPLAAVAGDAQLQEFASNPKVSSDQVFDLIAGAVPGGLPTAGQNFLRAVIENDRLAALPEAAAQFRVLLNASSGAADAVVYSAFPIDAGAGIRAVVGDEVLDTSVKARLEQMKAALTA